MQKFIRTKRKNFRSYKASVQAWIDSGLLRKLNATTAMTKAQIEEFIPQSPHVQKWVAADTSGYKSEAKDRTGWESKKQLENGTTTMGNQWQFLMKLSIYHPMIQQFTLGTYINVHAHKKTCTRKVIAMGS